MPFLTLVAVAAVLMGMLNSLGHFFVPALSPAMFNVAGIVMALTLIPFADQLGVQPITIVAIATLVGGLGQLAHSMAAAAQGRVSLPARPRLSGTKACAACCC